MYGARTASWGLWLPRGARGNKRSSSGHRCRRAGGCCGGAARSVGALTMGDQLLDEVRAAVQAKVEAKGEEWDEDDWTPFVQEAVLWLHDEKNKKKKHVVAAAAGLVLYGVTNEEELQAVGQGEYKEFKAEAVRGGRAEGALRLAVRQVRGGGQERQAARGERFERRLDDCQAAVHRPGQHRRHGSFHP